MPLQRHQEGLLENAEDVKKLDLGNKFFAVSTTVHCSNLPRDVVESPWREVFKVRPDRGLDNRLPHERWDQPILGGPCRPGPSWHSVVGMTHLAAPRSGCGLSALPFV